MSGNWDDDRRWRERGDRGQWDQGHAREGGWRDESRAGGARGPSWDDRPGAYGEGSYGRGSSGSRDPDHDRGPFGPGRGGYASGGGYANTWDRERLGRMAQDDFGPGRGSDPRSDDGRGRYGPSGRSDWDRERGGYGSGYGGQHSQFDPARATEGWGREAAGQHWDRDHGVGRRESGYGRDVGPGGERDRWAGGPRSRDDSGHPGLIDTIAGMLGLGGDRDRDRDRSGGRYDAPASRGPRTYTRSDARIEEDVNERLSRGGFDASDVSVAVKDGEVTLSGSVRSRADKRRAEDLADDVSGVKHVQNNLRVSEAWGSASRPYGAADRQEGAGSAEPSSRQSQSQGQTGEGEATASATWGSSEPNMWSGSETDTDSNGVPKASYGVTPKPT